MTDPSTNPTLALLRGIRNDRAFDQAPVDQGDLDAVLDVARRTGSAMNAQPWEFVVVRDREQIAAIAGTGPNLGWVAAAPLVIAIVMAGERAETERFDEGRLAERMMVAADALGLAAGLGWFFGAAGMAAGRQVLGVSERKTVRTIVAIGHPGGAAPKPPAVMLHRPTADRKPLADLVHFDRYGTR